MAAVPEKAAPRKPRLAASPLLNLVAAAALLFYFRSVLWPLVLAGVFWVLIEGAARRISRVLPDAGKWTVFVLTSVVTASVALAAMLVVFEGLYRVAEGLPQAQQRIEAVLATMPGPGGARLKLTDLAASLDMNAAAAKAVEGLKAAGSGLVLTMLYLVFLLASRPMIARRIRMIATRRRSSALLAVLRKTVEGVEAYVYIQTVTGLMIAAGAAAVMMALGLDNAILWALIIFLFSYLPVVGVLIGSLGPTVFAILQFSSAGPAIVIFAGVQAVSFVVSNLVLPKMQADSQNLDPSAGLLAVGVWTILWGVPGAFLAIPLTLAAMYALAQNARLAWIAVLLSNDGDPLPR